MDSHREFLDEHRRLNLGVPQGSEDEVPEDASLDEREITPRSIVVTDMHFPRNAQVHPAYAFLWQILDDTQKAAVLEDARSHQKPSSPQGMVRGHQPLQVKAQQVTPPADAQRMIIVGGAAASPDSEEMPDFEPTNILRSRSSSN